MTSAEQWLKSAQTAADVIPREGYRYLAYERKLDKDAKGGPVGPGSSLSKPWND